jgi:hypothetical protein
VGVTVVLTVPVVAGETGAGFETLRSGAPGKKVTFELSIMLRIREKDPIAAAMARTKKPINKPRLSRSGRCFVWFVWFWSIRVIFFN